MVVENSRAPRANLAIRLSRMYATSTVLLPYPGENPWTSCTMPNEK